MIQTSLAKLRRINGIDENIQWALILLIDCIFSCLE